jgi:hypothetical protein
MLKSKRRTHAFVWVPAPMNADKNGRLSFIGVHRRSSAFIGGCFFGFCVCSVNGLRCPRSLFFSGYDQK